MSDSITLVTSAETASVLAALESQPADALLALIGLHASDPRPAKIDVGIGVYRDASGGTPVFSAVKAAEARLVAVQATKSYLGPEGDARFTELLAEIVFGSALAAEGRLVGVQTPGGTGALRLGAELLARASPGRRVWVGTPTWPNHAPIFREAGLSVQVHRLFDGARSDLDFASMMEALDRAKRGDIVLLHGCCHNPTGADLSAEQWCQLADLLAARGLVPLIDLAYQGLGDGLEEDAAGMRFLLQSVNEALVAYSCDKNFGLYRERVGALWVLAAKPSISATVQANLFALARSLWSMPPDHGAAIVRVILDDVELRADWRAELDGMRERIAGLRMLLGAAHPRLAPIARQRGMFATLPIDGHAVEQLREQHGIYMAGSGRINIAGLKEASVPTFVAALAPFLGA